MKGAQPQPIFLKDYREPDYWITNTGLTFDLAEDTTCVTAELSITRNERAERKGAAKAPLRLHGEQLELISVELDGKPLGSDDFDCDPESLTVHQVPRQFVLKVVTRIKPQENTSLEGLYKSGGMFCTQCEAEGFRKITYYLDRPDVMSEFTTRIIADGSKYPVLLSNGNLVDSGELDGGRHYAQWHDPFKKPAYLFALVAGSLASIDDTFVTMSGREVRLRIFVEEKDLDKCDYAMQALKNAMAWDEKVYGREYDLDIFMIVAVDDFNMGAMENKGLNIFNTSCVLAKPETTTDAGFQRVEGVVAHEYFHNWSGNRVTCRDWFQLSLKEGFTVFRDAQFSADMGSPTVKRVEDVGLLRTLQFAEDAGPMAHPVQPDSYIEISNFYTLTIYEKGAEIVRMLHTLLGPELFRKGSDLYFERNDGKAVTIEDFVEAMADASGRDLSQFMNWYRQAGTPRLDVSGEYDETQRTFKLTVKQSCPPTPECKVKQPFHIPLAMGLLGDAGALPLRLVGEAPSTETSDNTHRVLEITEAEQTFVFEDVLERPVPSLLRGFSAPVRLSYDYSRDDLMRLMSRDTDGFCRWDATQQLSVQVIQEVQAAHARGETPVLDERLEEALRQVLGDPSLDKAMVALMLTLPSEMYLAELADVVDVDGIHNARCWVKKNLAQALKDSLKTVYSSCQDDNPYNADAASVARRSLKNTALSYLMLMDDDAVRRACIKQFSDSNNMTDVMAALTAIVNSESPALAEEKQRHLSGFYEQWKHEPLVVNQWFSVQASSTLPGGLERVEQLVQHPAFDIKNPNKVRSVIGVFANANTVNFHDVSGAGYRFLADQICILNRQNPQVAARLLTPLTKWRRYDENRQNLMRGELERIKQQPDLSKDVYEVVSKSLA
jgi:aminopeptidase N